MRMTILLTILCLLLLCLFHVACSLEEESNFAASTPALAPATRATERVQQTLDTIARDAQPIANTVGSVATDANKIGVPGAGVVALIATTVGALAGAYQQRRAGVTPLKTALTQIVQSIDAAFPAKTDQHKLAMSAVQDQATQQLVSQIRSG